MFIKNGMDAKIDALNCACQLIANSTEMDARKKAAQAIYIAEIFVDWLNEGIAPTYEGDINLIYNAANSYKYRRRDG